MAGLLIFMIFIGLGITIGGLKLLRNWKKIRTGKILKAEIVEWVKIKTIENVFKYAPKITFVNPITKGNETFILCDRASLLKASSVYHSKIQILIYKDKIQAFELSEIIVMIFKPISFIIVGLILMINAVYYLLINIS
jgi:hypothetical protein